MNTYISILRGVNVSGKNLIKMKALQEIYEGLGFRNVITYIQSGNVVFQDTEIKTAVLEQKISEAILKHFSLNVPVMVMDRSELKTILGHNPFTEEMKTCFEKLHITLLSKVPEIKFLENPDSENSTHDKFIVKGSTIYLFCPDGYGRTKFNNNFFENKLNLTATTRNLKTMTELLRISDTMAD